MYTLSLLFLGGHRYLGTYDYGNDEDQPQCDETTVASDGDVVVIEVLP